MGLHQPRGAHLLGVLLHPPQPWQTDLPYPFPHEPNVAKGTEGSETHPLLPPVNVVGLYT